MRRPARVLTIAAALLVTLPFVAAGEIDLAGIWPFLLAGVLGPGCSQLLFTLAVRDAGPSRTSVTVGTAPLFSVAIALVLLERAGEGGRDRRGDPDRHGRDPARARAGPARAREVDRARLRARGDDHLRRARQPRPAPVARHRRRAGARRRGDALRGRRHRRRLAARLAAAAPDVAASAPSSLPGVSSASPTSACSRPTTAAASRSSRRSSRRSRSGASRSRRCCCAGTSSSAPGSSAGRRSWSPVAL